jgi:hypothetical protein
MKHLTERPWDICGLSIAPLSIAINITAILSLCGDYEC